MEENATPLAKPEEQSIAPVDSGTTSTQRQDAPAEGGALVPRPQLSEVANCVSEEASGIVTFDPELLKGYGAQRIVVAYMKQQEANTTALRNDVADTQVRERSALAEASSLREKLAVAENINESERKLRAPRALFSFLGLAVASIGVERVVDKDHWLGIGLIVVGVLIVATTYLIAPAEGKKR